MLKGDLQSIRSEIENAEEFRDSHLKYWRNLIERFHGPAFRNLDEGEDDPENFVHEYIALVLPRIVHDAPKVRVKSARPITQGLTANILQIALNRWCKMTKIRTTLERIATDMLLGFGVGMIVNEPRKGYRAADDADPYLPRLYRISPDRFFIDPAATSVEDARFIGHCYIVDKEDLIEQANNEDGWDMELIERISANTGVDQIREDSTTDRAIPDREEVVIYEVWVPEVRDDVLEQVDSESGMNMFNGTIYTVLKHQAAGEKKAHMGFVRKPRPYWGPRSGPYEVFGIYTVPDDPYPLSPIVALIPQMDDVNSHLRNMRYGASAYKRLIAVDSRNPKLAQDIRDQNDLFVVLADGIDASQVVPIEVGGITAQQVNYAQLAQDRLDRISGIHDAMRGNVKGSATATEVAVAESSAGLRMSHIKRQFQESVNNALKTVAWFMFHDAKVEFPLGADGIPLLGANPEPVFSASSMVGVFDDLDLDIEAMSMERVSEQMVQRRALEMLQIIGNLSQAVITAPHVKWKDVMSLVGDAMNIPNLGDMIDINAGQAQQMQMPPSPAQSGMVTPSMRETQAQPAGRFARRGLE
jgi:hypothetical protein